MTAPKGNDGPFEKGTVLLGKLKPPQLHHVLERPRLLRLATPSEKHKLVLVNAGPGFGKTTLMAQVAHCLPGESVWYQVDSLDKDPAVFLRHLISGISQACEGVGKRSLARLNEASNPGEEGVSVLAVLADELGQKLESPLAICFDDFHLFDGEPFAAKLIDSLISDLPNRCTVFIASRTRPRLKMARLRSQGALLELGDRDLQFSREELKELLSETWRIKIDADALTELHKNTEGWPAGLVLIEDHLRSGDAVPELFAGRKVRRNVYEYLAEEVLGRQSEQLKDLLKKSALISPVDPHICREALGISDAPALLAAAEKMNLFTTRVGGSDLYRYHPLFRKFLLARLKESLTAGEIDELRVSFGAAYEQAGEKKKAVEQYLKSRQQEKAASIIEEVGREMLTNGECVTLERWLEEFRKPLSSVLEVYKGQLLLWRGKVSEALHLLRTAKGRIQQTDTTLCCETSVAIADCCSLLDRPHEGIEEIEPLLKWRLPAEARFNLLFWLCKCYWWVYDEANFKAGVFEAKKLAKHNPMAQLLGKVNFMLAMDHLRRGEFPEANKLLVDAVDGIDTGRMNSLAYCLMLQGRYKESMDLAERCLAQVQKQKEQKRFPMVYDTFAGCLAALGHWLESKSYLEKSVHVSSDLGISLADSCVSKCHLGTYARRHAEYTTAANFHSESLKIAEAYKGIYETAMCMLNLGADLQCMGQIDKAEKYFTKAHRIAIKQNFKYSITMIDFHRAWGANISGDKGAELSFLSAALKRANKHQHNHFMIQEGRICLPLFTTAINNQIETDYVFWILQQIGAPSLEVIASFINSDNKVIRTKCAGLLGTIDDPRAISLARKLLRDKEPEVRKLAREALKCLREKIISPHELLTQRESQVLKMIAAGSTNGQIARQMYISERTVKTHVTNLFRKLGLSSRLEAALYYQQSLQGNTTS